MSEDQKSESIPLNIDPETAQKVQDFLSEYQRKPQQEEQPEGPQRVEIKPDPIMNMPNPQDIPFRSAIANSKTDVTMKEREQFLKALMMDVPVSFVIELFGGQFKLEFRSRSSHEHRRILEILRLDEKEGIIPQDDAAFAITRLQQYCIAIMLKSINGEPFSSLSFKHGSSIDDDKVLIRNLVTEKLEGTTGIRWNALINGLRLFEEKCRICSEECANEDFWNPRG